MHGDFRTHHQRQCILAVLRRDDASDTPTHVNLVTADPQRLVQRSQQFAADTVNRDVCTFGQVQEYAEYVFFDVHHRIG